MAVCQSGQPIRDSTFCRRFIVSVCHAGKLATVQRLDRCVLTMSNLPLLSTIPERAKVMMVQAASER